MIHPDLKKISKESRIVLLTNKGQHLELSVDVPYDRLMLLIALWDVPKESEELEYLYKFILSNIK